MKTSKNGVYQRPLMKAGVIPPLGSVSLLVGRSGSGKSVLIANLLGRGEFYGVDESGKPYFDETVIFSTTAGTELDDTYSNIEWLKPKNFENDLKAEYIDGIIQSQA